MKALILLLAFIGTSLLMAAEVGDVDLSGWTKQPDGVIRDGNFPNSLRGDVYYVSDCGTGADADCVAGSDANDGLSMANAWQTYDKAQDIFASLGSGDSIRFAKGGSFTVAGSTYWENDNTIGISPLIISDYTPAWGSGDEVKPIISGVGTGNLFNMTQSGGSSLSDGNWTMSNLNLQCGANTSGYGIVFGDDVNDFVMDSLTVEGCYIGIYSQGWQACDIADTACNGRNERITISNSTIVNNRRAGFFGHGYDIVIENNTFTNNGFLEGQFGHNIYYSGGWPSRISGNTLYQSALNASGVCEGSSLENHGLILDQVIENNTIYEDVGLAAGGCWGISVNTGYGGQVESFTNVIIRNNIVTNTGNALVSVSACVGCLIENNTITSTQSYNVTGVRAPGYGRGAEDAVMTNVDVKTNTINITNNSTGNTGVNVGTEGTGHEITGNTVTYTGTGSITCTSSNLTATDITISANTCP